LNKGTGKWQAEQVCGRIIAEAEAEVVARARFWGVALAWMLGGVFSGEV
jgi:hypothetical protein